LRGSSRIDDFQVNRAGLAVVGGDTFAVPKTFAPSLLSMLTVKGPLLGLSTFE
jgi:hypothetical protein